MRAAAENAELKAENAGWAQNAELAERFARWNGRSLATAGTHRCRRAPMTCREEATAGESRGAPAAGRAARARRAHTWPAGAPE